MTAHHNIHHTVLNISCSTFECVELLLQIRDDVRKSALWSMCGFMMQVLLFDLPSNNYSDTSYLNVFSTPYLTTESQVNASWAVYASKPILCSAVLVLHLATL